MSFNRRFVLTAAAGLAAPAPAAAWPFGPRRRKPQARAAYAGPPLRPQLAEAHFEAAKAAGSSRLQPVIRDGLEARFEQARARMPQAAAITAAVVEPDGAAWTHTWAAGGGAPPRRFHWASLGEAYTATAVMQMVEKGKLALDATLDRWAPQMPNAAVITVEDLLAHTSGLYDAQTDAALRAEPGYKPPERLLAVAAAHPPPFDPGATWSYSSTGYVLLGRIIEAVDDRPYHEALMERIVARRELPETTILAPQQVSDGLAQPAAGPGPAETAQDLTTPYATGVVAASALDMARFWRALFAERLHGGPALRRRFARLHPMPGPGGGHYGLGVMVSDLSATDPNASDVWLGHAGAMPGAAAVGVYSAQTRAFAAVALTGEGSPQAVANLLLDALRQA